MRYREGMSCDPAQLPRDLKEPATEAGQSPSAALREAPGEIIGYLIDGKLYHPADVVIVRAAP